MTKYDGIAERMIERRAELGWTQEQLSKESGVAAAQISRYEAGINTPRANVIAKLAKGMMIPFSWLAYGDPKDFIQEPLPAGETEYHIHLPADIAEMIDAKAKEAGIEPHEMARRILLLYKEQYEGESDN
ncbi:helix-turn-helix domain-containing protein [Yersinia intermedia]|uniref:helix-turn-helix domain-containing protein n=1 Tax=Yersinia intermedia TaxID=631 RepID=UPI0005AD4A2B|nr:helix-turn-helix transcriptional regulator [Yersinia intermedia]AJJ19360.1 helix-turn-helix family protein [Yersinia intermedia]